MHGYWLLVKILKKMLKQTTAPVTLNRNLPNPCGGNNETLGCLRKSEQVGTYMLHHFQNSKCLKLSANRQVELECDRKLIYQVGGSLCHL